MHDAADNLRTDSRRPSCTEQMLLRQVSADAFFARGDGVYVTTCRLILPPRCDDRPTLIRANIRDASRARLAPRAGARAACAPTVGGDRAERDPGKNFIELK